MDKKIASEISRLVWEKLMAMVKEDESVIESLGCNGISDVVLNVILDYDE